MLQQYVATNLLNEPTPVYRFETSAEALSVWRQAASQKPSLLLLSNNPHLQPVPGELRSQAAALLNRGDPTQLALETSQYSSAPLLLPGMTVDAALRNGWFRAVDWALPLRESTGELSLQRFKEQFSKVGVVDAKELASFALSGEILSGTIRDVPFMTAPLPAVRDISQPVIVHIDLGYFQPLYKNEISTPLLELIHKTLATLKSLQLKTIAVTFAYNHRDGAVPLDVRFVGDIIAYLIEDPSRLEQPIPINWRRQRDVLYLSSFFQKEEVLTNFLKQEQEAPNEAWIKFNLYRAYKALQDMERANDYLNQAVALDSTYALEYLNLSDLAHQQHDLDEARHLLEQVGDVFPDDVFIQLRLAELANEAGESSEALMRLDKLRALEWSATYYPQVANYLRDLSESVQYGKPPADATKVQPGQRGEVPPEGDGSKQLSRRRVLHTHEILLP